jgi:hypothetical protein
MIILNKLNFSLFRRNLIKKGFDLMILYLTEEKYSIYPEILNSFARIVVFSVFDIIILKKSICSIILVV